ncbi:hypothetical protein M9Y10_001772 [Tritrichomonas musculus]|uniref:Uncharacterized protein n=1 Tax=Tritrichomonas musculus TaxID=1915356 RepID=A0ABR2L7X6_9EUKA
MKKEEEHSISLGSNEFSNISPFSTPNTHRISSKSPEDLSNLISDIETLTKEINQYAEENANARLKCKELEEKMEKITMNLNHHIDKSEETNKNLELKNQQLQGVIDNQESLKQQLIDYYAELAFNGINLKKFRAVDYNLLVNLAGREIPVAEDELNSDIKMIISSEPFFHNCHTNEDFIKRCSDLVAEASSPTKYTKPKTKDLDYEELIMKLQQYHDQTHAEIANEMKMLSQERDELLKELKYDKNMNQNNNDLMVSKSSIAPNQSMNSNQGQNLTTNSRSISNIALENSVSKLKQKSKSNHNHSTKSRHHHHQKPPSTSTLSSKSRTKSKK